MAFTYFPLTSAQVAQRRVAWEGLAGKRAFGRAAIRFCSLPSDPEAEREVPPADEIPLVGPAGTKPEWDSAIRKQVRALHVAAAHRWQDDVFPAIDTPRSIFGQSQGLAEAFGCKLPQETEPGLYFPVPWIETAADVDRIKVTPIEKCLYGQAIEFARYARAVTGGHLAIRNPVMTGPLDTANYVLGTTRLMEWTYAEPRALKGLLKIITGVLVETLRRLQAAADGQLCPEVSGCLPRGFGLCSEVRALISAEQYAEFEAPYLRQLGAACGPYAIHGCGTWERTLPALLEDHNVMLINFQCREMDLRKVCALGGGRLSLSIGRSVELGEKYTWPDAASFYQYVISTLSEPMPVELLVYDNNLHDATFLAVQQQLQGGPSRMFCWRPTR